MPLLSTLLAALALASTPPTSEAVEAQGPLAPLKGTLLRPTPTAKAVVVIVPGSGPTDRDGNSQMGIAAAPYRLLAEALVAEQIATLRIDKRGLFGSRGAIADANAVTIADYAGDVRAWARVARARTGLRCAWVLGHSEGGLVALAAAQQSEGICGLILVSSPGRPFGTVIREQLQANPGNAPLLTQALAAIESLEAGRTVDTTGMNPALLPLFARQVQPYVIDLMRNDPAKLAAKVRIPVLIVQGDRDLQVRIEDARALAAADPAARLVIIPGANHVLKAVASQSREANLATYGDPSLPLAPGIVEAIVGFVTAPPRGR